MNPQDIAALTRKWSPEQKHALIEMFSEGDALADARQNYSHPAELLADCDPRYVVTPAIELISREIELTLDTPGRNLLITAPPQEGKSMLTCIGTPARALQKNPDARCILAMYGDAMATEHGGKCRDLFARHGTGALDPLTGRPMPNKLGLGLDPKYGSAGRWKLNGHDGGLVSAGIGSGITGRPADLFIMDDPYKVRGEADSPAYRRKVEAFFESVVFLRLGPGANIIMILTRWHDEDIAGWVLAREAELDESERTWHHINIPALSAEGVDDALGRPPGVYLDSARGRTPRDFQRTRRNVGERTFWAMYQGVPRPPEGGIFKQQWMDDCTLDEEPDEPEGGVVAVDPAETGENDEAGIVAAVRIGGQTVFTHDWSGKMTSEQWARKTALLAASVKARVVRVEAYTAGVTYVSIIRTAMRRLGVQARETDGYVDGVDCSGYARNVFPRVREWRGKGDAEERAAGLIYAAEAGLVRFSPAVADLVSAAVGWQTGQHCPDRVAAAVIAYDEITPASGRLDRSPLVAPKREALTAATPTAASRWGQRVL